MKIKVLYSITALLILTLSFVVYASLNTTSANNDSCCAMADCCKDGKCKMNHDCCKDKDSCPMKAKEKASGEMKDCPMHKGKEMSTMHNHEGKSCCDMPDCCKDGKCSMNADGKCNCKSHAEHKCTEDCCKDGKCKMSADGKCACECCKDGKCDMKAHKKDGNHQAMNHDCCKDKDSCPMKKEGENKDKPKDN